MIQLTTMKGWKTKKVPDTSYEARYVNGYFYFFVFLFFHFTDHLCSSVMTGRLILLFRVLRCFCLGSQSYSTYTAVGLFFSTGLSNTQGVRQARPYFDLDHIRASIIKFIFCFLPSPENGWKIKNETHHMDTAFTVLYRQGFWSLSIAQQRIRMCRATAIIAIFRRLALPWPTRW